MMASRAGALALAVLIILGLAACLPEASGYVEIKVLPGFRLPPLALGADKISALKDGTAILRQPVGQAALQFERNGELIPFCRFDVKKDRIVTVTVSAFGRAPRCKVLD